MTDYREIIRLKSLEFSNVAIATVYVAHATRFLKFSSSQKHTLWDGLSRIRWPTATLRVCFIQTEAIMREGGFQITSISITNWPSRE